MSRSLRKIKKTVLGGEIIEGAKDHLRESTMQSGEKMSLRYLDLDFFDIINKVAAFYLTYNRIPRMNERDLDARVPLASWMRVYRVLYVYNKLSYTEASWIRYFTTDEPDFTLGCLYFEEMCWLYSKLINEYGINPNKMESLVLQNDTFCVFILRWCQKMSKMRKAKLLDREEVQRLSSLKEWIWRI